MRWVEDEVDYDTYFGRKFEVKGKLE